MEFYGSERLRNLPIEVFIIETRIILQKCFPVFLIVKAAYWGEIMEQFPTFIPMKYLFIASFEKKELAVIESKTLPSCNLFKHSYMVQS